MKNNMLIDASYNIKEIEVDNSWAKDLSDNDYLEYRKKWDLASHNYHLFNFPLFVEVESSYLCNYRCPKCPRQIRQHIKSNGFLSDRLFDKLFDETKQYRMPSINFSHGGEPLMRKNISELVQKAKDSYILDRMIHTNASLLTKELSIDLIKSGLTKINFSLDAASSEIYNIMRPGGNYERVITNINEFLVVKSEFGKSYPRVRVSFLVTDENKHQQNKFYELWKNKVNLIAFQQCYDFSKMKNSDKNELKKHAVRKHCCSQLWQLLTITCDGDIVICERDYNNECVLGNLRTHTIYECWHSETMKKIREQHLKNRWYEVPICRKLGLNNLMTQLYAILYLNDKPMSLNDMVERLRVSKGSVSVNIRALERYGAARKVWIKGSRKDYYEVEIDIVKVIMERVKSLTRDRLSEVDGMINASYDAINAINSSNKEEQQAIDAFKQKLNTLRNLQSKAQSMYNLFNSGLLNTVLNTKIKKSNKKETLTVN